MIYNSFQFIWLFPLIFLAYYSLQYVKNEDVRHRLSNSVLLIISYLLYMQWDAAYTLILLWVTLVTYGGALVIFRRKAFGKKKYLITTGVLLALCPLLVFKYYDFIHFQVGAVLSSFNIGMEMAGLNWAIPLGISFYTFQAIGYLWDVYYRKIEPERNWWDYMLFVSFFPQILSGPISKASDLLPQIKAHRSFNYRQAVAGCKDLLWGMFLKVVFADRMGLVVNTIVPNYMELNGASCALGAVLYSLQIYGDFAGYSLMAVGVGKIMGFNLVNNFCRPYFAPSVTDFWKRWHISLTRWLTDYIFIPLGGSRCDKVKNYRNILITFLVSGVWHGANWTFIFWGLLHGVAQCIEKALGLRKVRFRWIKPLRIVITFVFVTLAWIFFRADTIDDAFNIIVKIFTEWEEPDVFISDAYYFFMLTGIGVVFVKEFFDEYFPKVTLMSSRFVLVRWTTYLALLSMILLFGVLDASSFIYSSF